MQLLVRPRAGQAEGGQGNSLSGTFELRSDPAFSNLHAGNGPKRERRTRVGAPQSGPEADMALCARNKRSFRKISLQPNAPSRAPSVWAHFPTGREGSARAPLVPCHRANYIRETHDVESELARLADYLATPRSATPVDRPRILLHHTRARGRRKISSGANIGTTTKRAGTGPQGPPPRTLVRNLKGTIAVYACKWAATPRDSRLRPCRHAYADLARLKGAKECPPNCGLARLTHRVGFCAWILSPRLQNRHSPARVGRSLTAPLLQLCIRREADSGALAILIKSCLVEAIART